MVDLLDLSRRSLLERMLWLAGAAATSGFSGASLAQTADKKPAYLNATDFALLSAVAETIIPRTDTPGAIDARVPAGFDALLAEWASPQRRDSLAQILRDIDAYARAQEGTGFAHLSSVRQKRLLTVYDAEALKPVPPPPLANASVQATASATVANPLYASLKELIVILYYLSEPALTHELSYIHAPGEWQPSVPVTSETRPAGGGIF